LKIPVDPGLFDPAIGDKVQFYRNKKGAVSGAVFCEN